LLFANVAGIAMTSRSWLFSEIFVNQFNMRCMVTAPHSYLRMVADVPDHFGSDMKLLLEKSMDRKWITHCDRKWCRSSFRNSRKAEQYSVTLFKAAMVTLDGKISVIVRTRSIRYNCYISVVVSWNGTGSHRGVTNAATLITPSGLHQAESDHVNVED